MNSTFQLIQCKADPNTVNEHGNTPLHYACFWGQDEVAEVQRNENALSWGETSTALLH